MSIQYPEYSPNSAPNERTQPCPQPENADVQYYSSHTDHWVSGQRIYDGEGTEYVIQKELGRGGFGITYLAIDNNNHQVVIKILRKELRNRSDFDQLEENFLNEALKLQACQHRYIVPVIKVSKFNEQWGIVMEYIEGMNLKELTQQRSGILSIAEALKYIQQIGEALQYVHHQQGLLHRDIKPDNILIRKNQQEAVLIDFGIAFKFDPDSIQKNPGWLTPGYAPIEQYRSKLRWGFYTDVYALAATLYYVLTGEQPTPADNRDGLENLKKLTDFNPKISQQINDAVLKGMTFAPGERPQSIEEWLALFESPKNIINYFNKSILTVLILIVSLILSIFYLPKFYQNLFIRKSPILENAQDKILEYKSSKYEFKTNYPSSWQYQEFEKNAILPWQVKFHAPETTANITITVQELNELFSRQEYLEKIIKPAIYQYLKPINFQESEAVVRIVSDAQGQKSQGVQHHPAMQIEYTFKREGSLVKRVELAILYNYRGYNVIYETEDIDNSKLEKNALKILQSFEVMGSNHEQN